MYKRQDSDTTQGEDASGADTSTEDTATTDATEPDATEPDTTEPDATEPDATEPDATEPDATEPDATEPDVTEPDATEPDATEPDVTEPFVCGEGVTFTGQATLDPTAPFDSPNGGVGVTTPFPSSYDSGIDDIWARAPVDDDVTDSVDPDPVDVTIDIVGATVIATGPALDAGVRSQTQFWIADGRNTVQFFLPLDDPSVEPPFTVRVGQRVSFTALSIGRYRGVAQVYAATNWLVESEENEVAFREVGGDILSFDDVPQNVRVTGEITEVSGPCGGASTCYRFTYGDGAQLTFRSASDFVEVGDCVTFAGPLGTFGGVPQLDTQNFDWFTTYSE